MLYKPRNLLPMPGKRGGRNVWNDGGENSKSRRMVPNTEMKFVRKQKSPDSDLYSLSHSLWLLISDFSCTNHQTLLVPQLGSVPVPERVGGKDVAHFGLPMGVSLASHHGNWRYCDHAALRGNVFQWRLEKPLLERLSMVLCLWGCLSLFLLHWNWVS